MNHKNKMVIFGAWDIALQGSARKILDDNWELSPKTGRIQPAYGEALEYIGLVQKGGYALRTFPMGHSLADPSQPDSTARIKSFQPFLSEGVLVRHGHSWLALSARSFEILPDEEEVELKEDFFEGERRPVLVSAVERNPKARAKCLELFGCKCAVCKFDFLKVYGELGLGFIHVHHINPMGKSDGPRKVDPSRDLIPVCPNCHAMIHRKSPPYSVKEIASLILEAQAAK